jgi:hypothetical protein
MFSFDGMYVWHLPFFCSFIRLDEGTADDTIVVWYRYKIANLLQFYLISPIL